MRTTLDLPDPTFRKLKAEASLRGLKLKEMVCQLIEAGLAAKKTSINTVRPRRSALPAFRKATGMPHPSLSNAKLDEILAIGESHGGR